MPAPFEPRILELIFAGSTFPERSRSDPSTPGVQGRRPGLSPGRYPSRSYRVPSIRLECLRSLDQTPVSNRRATPRDRRTGQYAGREAPPATAAPFDDNSPPGAIWAPKRRARKKGYRPTLLFRSRNRARGRAQKKRKDKDERARPGTSLESPR